MKNKILAVLLCFGLSGCNSTQPINYKPMIQPAVFVITKKVIDKNPKNTPRLLIVADGLELLSKGIEKTLVLQDFVAITTKAGQEPEWALLAQYLYDIYKENVKVSDNYLEASKIILSISRGIRDAVSISTPAK